LTTEAKQRDVARARIAELVRNFQRNETDYLQSTYNETQARTDFITPFLEAFGWDVHNEAGHPVGFREVVEEATVEVGVERLSKRPDYELRLARQRKLFVEAKKPSVAIDRSREAAFQTRRYGYSASLPIAVLTSFYQLAVYDCQPVPVSTDEAHVARILLMRYDEFEARFDELWSILSRQVVYSGDFDRHFAVGSTRHGAEQFDDFFLRQVKSWRERLAVDIHANTPGLSPSELTYAVQLFLSRIVFLRICEDREIERYETLKNLPPANTFNALMDELRRADQFYDSGLFRLLDDARLGLRISDKVLHNIITELYYPQSPYTFAVVETEVLGEIYELFLGEEITIDGNSVTIVSKPEVRESGGVVPTPRYIVDAIAEKTLLPAIAGKSPIALSEFTTADICCGSGIFLLSLYELLLDHYLAWYLANDRAAHVGRTIYDAGADQWRLTYVEKRRILCTHIRGVDIDHNAVEVARFSLLLKLIEGEELISLREYVRMHRTPALPELDFAIKSGNSLVSPDEWAIALGAMPASLVTRVNSFDWSAEFPAEMLRGGFDVIVGNPPYIRIQNMATYSPEEVTFYQHPASPYHTAHQDNFDKYALFIERSISLLSPAGRLGVITPHKFMSIQAGRALRRLIASSRLLEQVIHFGVKQVFGRKASNYTCILILSRRSTATVCVEQVGPLEEWRYGTRGKISEIQSDTLGEDTWQFAEAETRQLFDRIRDSHPACLRTVAEIFVGVQTSADAIYIFKSIAESPSSVTLRWNDRDWLIERDIIRPCLLDVSLNAYSRPKPNAWMIFPYAITTTKRGEKANLIQPDEMARRFPVCLAYLTARRVELEKRNVAGGLAEEQQFYQFGRSQSLTKFNSPKIILPILSVEPRYAYDNANIVVTGGGNGPYYMIRALPERQVSDFYLIAVLNHPFSEALVRTNTSTFRGGYYSHGKQFIENLPIPIPSDHQREEIEIWIGELIEANSTLAAARTPHEKTLNARRVQTLRKRIEAQITELFGLSPSDMDIVQAVPIPS
jgi:type I restriction-modification system DNA methylase subunit